MPERNVFLLAADEREIITQVLSLGGWLVPGGILQSKEHPIIRTIDHYDLVRVSERYFYVLHSDFFQCPLEVFQVRDGYYKGHYHILPRNGGPYIELLFAINYCVNNKDGLLNASISHYPSYWDWQLKRNEQAPICMKKFYGSILAKVLKGAEKITTQNGNTFWITSRAIQEIRKGARLRGIPLIDYEHLMKNRRDN